MPERIGFFGVGKLMVGTTDRHVGGKQNPAPDWTRSFRFSDHSRLGRYLRGMSRKSEHVEDTEMGEGEMQGPVRVTVWNEFIHERAKPEVKAIYPDGIHGAIQTGLVDRLGERVVVTTATLDQPEHGLSETVVGSTDVLIWWGHAAHEEVSDEVVERIQNAVLGGMGLLVLHSGHESKIFRRLMGTTCMLRWRDDGEQERLWVVDPGHPILEGIDGEYFEIPQAEMYGEHFDIPSPDELILISWFEGGEIFRSGCTFRRGKGKIFYFRPGHETFPIYYQPEVQKIMANGVMWSSPSGGDYEGRGRQVATPLNSIRSFGDRS